MNGLGVVFDMDGVLIDSYRAHFEAWNRMGARHGVAMTQQQFAESFGRVNRDIIPALWGAQAGSDADAWGEEKEADYRDIISENFPEMDGAKELVASLAAAGFSLAVGSSGPPENVAAMLAGLPGCEHFAASVDAADVTRGKPDPQVFLKAAEKLGLDAAKCAVVEDARAGLAAARAAKMAAIGITGTATREQLAERADLVVDSLRELTPGVIERLIAAGAGGLG